MKVFGDFSGSEVLALAIAKGEDGCINADHRHGRVAIYAACGGISPTRLASKVGPAELLMRDPH